MRSRAARKRRLETAYLPGLRRGKMDRGSLDTLVKKFEASAPYILKDGYAYFCKEKTIELDFNMAPRFVTSAPQVHDNAGRVALMCGPVVYCAEGVDNEGDIFGLSVSRATDFEITEDDYFG